MAAPPETEPASPDAASPMRDDGHLERVLGIPGAVLLGLGSIVGSGVFVAIGVAAEVAGPWLLAAIALGALTAMFNGLSSAQLAAVHPVSGGTYEYGYRFLHPALGFVAGWMFLLAKSASAATAALGFGAYVALAVGSDGAVVSLLALAAVGVLTAVVLGGIRRSTWANAAIVGVTLFALGAFVVAGAPTALERLVAEGVPALGGVDGDLRGLLYATALMFVAYTGYGRVATLGEEVRDPRRTIPRAVVSTLVLTALLYLAVAFVAVGIAGAPALAEATGSAAAPLERIAGRLGIPGVPRLVALGAVTALLGVLLNLILGLSRVLLAMGRRGDAPARVARVDRATPRVAVLVVAGFIGALTLVGDVGMTWTFSAATVLVYYAITNAAALALPLEARFVPRWISWAGLASCLGLVAFIPWPTLALSAALIVAGLAWRASRRA